MQTVQAEKRYSHWVNSFAFSLCTTRTVQFHSVTSSPLMVLYEPICEYYYLTTASSIQSLTFMPATYTVVTI